MKLVCLQWSQTKFNQGRNGVDAVIILRESIDDKKKRGKYV